MHAIRACADSAKKAIECLTKATRSVRSFDLLICKCRSTIIPSVNHCTVHNMPKCQCTGISLCAKRRHSAYNNCMRGCLSHRDAPVHHVASTCRLSYPLRNQSSCRSQALGSHSCCTWYPCMWHTVPGTPAYNRWSALEPSGN